MEEDRNQDLASRLGIDDGREIEPRAHYMALAIDALVETGFADATVVRDPRHCWFVFVWIAIHEYTNFGALNETAGVASGMLFDWLDALVAAGMLLHDDTGRVDEWSYTERGRLAAYLVRVTLEDFASGFNR